MSTTTAGIAAKLRLRIKRQDGEGQTSYYEEFEIPYREKMNVISALMEVRKNPVRTDGKTVQPPAWEAACLEEVCGSCTMRVNGMVRQSCTALIEQIGHLVEDTYHVTLEPMSKFPVTRDLIVDRGEMFDNLKKVKAWVPIDGSYDLGPAEPQDDHVRQLRYSLSRCMSCGCCVEACPQVSEKTSFVGPAALGFLTSEEGISGCGNAQNCVKVCPKGVPLTRAIAQLNRDTSLYSAKKWLGFL
jgi:succinate dehydrogenase / fumarate reductase iron-sulfur subunit